MQEWRGERLAPHSLLVTCTSERLKGAVERIQSVVITERENIAPRSGKFRGKRGEITAPTKRGP